MGEGNPQIHPRPNINDVFYKQILFSRFSTTNLLFETPKLVETRKFMKISLTNISLLSFFMYIRNIDYIDAKNIRI